MRICWPEPNLVYDWPNMDETSAYAACYTTGTTGKPKGVYYSHRDVYLHSSTIGINTDISTKDTLCQVVPMFHALGWGLCQAATMVGARIEFCPACTPWIPWIPCPL